MLQRCILVVTNMIWITESNQIFKSISPPNNLVNLFLNSQPDEARSQTNKLLLVFFQMSMLYQVLKSFLGQLSKERLKARGSHCLFTTHWSAWSQCLLPQQNEWQNLQKWDAEVSMCDLGDLLCFRLHDLQYRIPHTLGSGVLCLGGIFQFFGITKPVGKE